MLLWTGEIKYLNLYNTGLRLYIFYSSKRKNNFSSSKYSFIYLLITEEQVTSSTVKLANVSVFLSDL